ncbi:hypothetical protein [Segetibacter koreensis]|uniref:hypothetical protein n=1 Tax=Segetibacter koreensis TaxID=398037 RepID=UPI000360E662|nr:hypothetical protein [Segetibacter koreensis]
MRKNTLLIFVTLFCFACNNGKVDERKLDEAGDKLQKTVKKTVDSAGATIKRLKDKLDKDSMDTIR